MFFKSKSWKQFKKKININDTDFYAKRVFCTEYFNIRQLRENVTFLSQKNSTITTAEAIIALLMNEGSGIVQLRLLEIIPSQEYYARQT